MMRERRWPLDLLLSLGCVAGLLLLAFLCIDFSFDTNDDLGMISILNGSYTGTPDGHAIFIQYPLGWLIAALYRTGIQVSWYLVVLLGICLLAMVSVLFRLLRRLPEHRPLVVAGFLCAVVCLWLFNLLQFTFTTCGAFVAGMTVLAFALQTREEDLHPGFLANVLVLLVCSYCIRSFFCYAAVAFLGVVWLGKYAREMFSKPRCWLIPLAGLICLGASVGIHEFAYRDWDDYTSYNLDRVYLQDYDRFPNYTEHEAFIQSLGYDYPEYFTIYHYDYGLLESFGPEVIEELAAYAKSLQEPESLPQTAKRSLKQAVDYYFIDNWEEITPLQAASYLLPAALLALSLALSIRDRKWYILFSLLLLAAVGCCWLFIGYRGRYPDRIAYSLRILTVTGSLAGLAQLFVLRPVRLPRARGAQLVSLALAAVLALTGAAGFWNLRQSRGGPENQTMEYLSYISQYPENIYIRDTRSTQYDKKLLSEFPNISVNVIATGSWSAYSPLYYEKLEAMGLEELSRETLFQDNVYLIIRNHYDLHEILGVGESAPVEYDVVQEFDDGIQILKIHSIG